MTHAAYPERMRSAEGAVVRTNILFLTADDMEGTTPGAFGGPDGVTPTLDALAADSMIFRRGHVAIAVCQPSRSAIMTGQWPHRNGAEGFEPIDDDVPLLTELLAAAGYTTGILGKVDHLQPVERFGWDRIVGMRSLGLGRDPLRYAAEVRSFLDLAGDGPWFLMVNAHDPHRPFHGADDVQAMFGDSASVIPEPSRVFTAADGISPPVYLPDLPDVRDEFAQYLSSARRCDDVIREVLDALNESGQRERTLIVFLSDNGMAFPFSKANCYLQSTHTPLIVQWPEVTEPGAAHDGFVSALDLFPTFCEAAGVDAPSHDGRSLIPILRGDATDPQDHVVTVFHETSRKERFEMRCVQDERFGYIWNGWSDGTAQYRAENMAGLTWPAMVAAAAADPELARRVDFYRHRAPEELYDLRSDPGALNDVMPDPAYADVVARLRRRLAEWMEATGDPLQRRFADLIESGRP
jgi:N-sulfoglucosamine sulfohydrolase